MLPPELYYQHPLAFKPAKAMVIVIPKPTSLARSTGHAAAWPAAEAPTPSACHQGRLGRRRFQRTHHAMETMSERSAQGLCVIPALTTPHCQTVTAFYAKEAIVSPTMKKMPRRAKPTLIASIAHPSKHIRELAWLGGGEGGGGGVSGGG